MNAHRLRKRQGERVRWEWLVPRALHAVKVAIVETLFAADQPMTATELTRAFRGVKTSKQGVSYHLKGLAKMGAVVEVERIPIGFATERYFELSPEMTGEAAVTTPQSSLPDGTAAEAVTMEDGRTSEFDWPALIARLVHPTKVGIIEALSGIGQPLSATDLTKLFGDPKQHYLSKVSYHARKLEKDGLLAVARRRPVRGAIEQFYVIQDDLLKR
jgi:DNA-binding transcriptional ArsR family regulator